MEEKCINCQYCKELYFPPTRTEEARHEHCCTLFLDENSVMYLGNNTSGLCECFSEKEKVNPEEMVDFFYAHKHLCEKIKEKENENDGE